MPQTKRDKKQSKKLPMIFYKSIPAKDINKKTVQFSQTKKPEFDFVSNGNGTKLIWLWSAVAVIMAAIIFFWTTSLPAALKVNIISADEAAKIFGDNKKQFKEIFQAPKDDLEKIKKQAAIILQAAAAASTSTSSTYAIASATSTLTAEQLNSLKNKINNLKK